MEATGRALVPVPVPVRFWSRQLDLRSIRQRRTNRKYLWKCKHMLDRACAGWPWPLNLLFASEIVVSRNRATRLLLWWRQLDMLRLRFQFGSTVRCKEDSDEGYCVFILW